MAGMAWDPLQYLRFESERARPFHDLVNRIDRNAPARIVDLGGAPGNPTATLLPRWPAATVLGIHSSAELIATAAQFARPRANFPQPPTHDWPPPRPAH